MKQVSNEIICTSPDGKCLVFSSFQEGDTDIT
ncbi:MAG: hypothetical protein F6K54_39610 [Okeania sp. SIO3B5]|nr:hypothetical protein [Okeania sp. SIO3B5]